MNFRRRFSHPLLLGALVLGFVAATPAVAAVYVDGYVTTSPGGDCVLVRSHEGRTYVLEGSAWRGVIGNDHVRLEGRFVPERRCGVRDGFEVTDVSTIWSDGAHRVVSYARERDGRFSDWVQRHRHDEMDRWDRDRREHRDRHEHGEEHHEPPPPLR
jgi:hypothetical protein